MNTLYRFWSSVLGFGDTVHQISTVMRFAFWTVFAPTTVYDSLRRKWRATSGHLRLTIIVTSQSGLQQSQSCKGFVIEDRGVFPTTPQQERDMNNTQLLDTRSKHLWIYIVHKTTEVMPPEHLQQLRLVKNHQFEIKMVGIGMSWYRRYVVGLMFA